MHLLSPNGLSRMITIEKFLMAIGDTFIVKHSVRFQMQLRQSPATSAIRRSAVYKPFSKYTPLTRNQPVCMECFLVITWLIFYSLTVIDTFLRDKLANNKK